MIDRSWEGKWTEPVVVRITREMVQAYAQVLEETQAVYLDIAAAHAAGFPDLAVPPTLPAALWQYLDIPWLPKEEQVFLRGQAFHYYKPVFANQNLICSIQLKQMNEKKRGRRIYQVLEHVLTCWSYSEGNGNGEEEMAGYKDNGKSEVMAGDKDEGKSRSNDGLPQGSAFFSDIQLGRPLFFTAGSTLVLTLDE